MKLTCLILLATVALAEVPDRATVDGVSIEVSQLTLQFPKGPSDVVAVNVCLDGPGNPSENLSVSVIAQVAIPSETNPNAFTISTRSFNTQLVSLGDRRCGVAFLQGDRRMLRNLQVSMQKVVQFQDTPATR